MMGQRPSGREVISLQKADSLLVLEVSKAKRFLRRNTGGIWIIKIHLNPNMQICLAKVAYDKNYLQLNKTRVVIMNLFLIRPQIV
jgi:hypothetical protein